MLVHGLAIDKAGHALIRKRGASLIVCPSSNEFLFGVRPDASSFGDCAHVAIGNDSPLTAVGDLLDEARFAIGFGDISPRLAYRMITETPAAILKLRSGTGTITVGGVGDLIAVRDIGQEPAERLRDLSMMDVELVMIGGCIHLASDAVIDRLPLQAKKGLEPLWIDGVVRWLRAPIGKLVQKAEAVLGAGAVQLGGRLVRIPA